jgi:hypothetical protein
VGYVTTYEIPGGVAETPEFLTTVSSAGHRAGRNQWDTPRERPKPRLFLGNPCVIPGISNRCIGTYPCSPSPKKDLSLELHPLIPRTLMYRMEINSMGFIKMRKQPIYISTPTTHCHRTHATGFMHKHKEEAVITTTLLAIIAKFLSSHGRGTQPP